jgi:transposase
MAKPLVSDELWAVVAPLLPPEPPEPKGGRPRVPDRACLTGIVFVLKSGIPWELLPREMGRGSGMTCWRRLRDRNERGVWDRLHRVLLDRLGEAGQIDRSRACPGSASIPAKRGAISSAPTPPTAANRARSGTCSPTAAASRSARGWPGPTATTAPSSRRGSTRSPPSSNPPGRRRKRPGKPHADKAYDIPRCRRALTARRIRIRIARKGIDSSKRLGRHRWVVERTLAWLNRYRRLTTGYERRADIHDGFLTLGCALICFKALPP